MFNNKKDRSGFGSKGRSGLFGKKKPATEENKDIFADYLDRGMYGTRGEANSGASLENGMYGKRSGVSLENGMYGNRSGVSPENGMYGRRSGVSLENGMYGNLKPPQPKKIPNVNTRPLDPYMQRNNRRPAPPAAQNTRKLNNARPAAGVHNTGNSRNLAAPGNMPSKRVALQKPPQQPNMRTATASQIRGAHNPAGVGMENLRMPQNANRKIQNRPYPVNNNPGLGAGMQKPRASLEGGMYGTNNTMQQNAYMRQPSSMTGKSFEEIQALNSDKYSRGKTKNRKAAGRAPYADFGNNTKVRNVPWKPQAYAPARKASGFSALRIILLLLVVTFGGYFVYSRKYTKTFFPNTYAYGINISNKSPEQARELLKQSVKDYSIKVKSKNGEETLSANQLGLKYVYDESLDNILASQNALVWAKYIFGKSEIKPENILQIDDAALKSSLISMGFFNTGYVNADIENSVVSKYVSGVGYQLVSPAAGDGNGADSEKAQVAIKAAALSLAKEVDLNDPSLGVYMESDSANADNGMQKQIDLMNKSLKSVIKYDNGTELNIDVTSQWISLSGSGEITFDQKAVEDFVAELAKSYNTIYKPRTFTATTGETLTITGGNYGWRVNQIGEAAAIKKLILEGKASERTPEFSKTAASKTEPDYGNTYIEVNLTSQHLYYYKNGQKVFESDFVSGNEASGKSTPAGVYQVMYKRENAVLSNEGENNNAKYWLPFNGNIGFNDAPWRSGFGGETYKNEGSQGNINLPPDAAKSLFESVENGTPVLCFRTDNTDDIVKTQPDQSESVAVAQADEQPTETVPETTPPPQTAPPETTQAPTTKKGKKQKATTAAAGETTAVVKNKNKNKNARKTQPSTTVSAGASSNQTSAPPQTSTAPRTTAAPTQPSKVVIIEDTVPQVNEPIRANPNGPGVKK